MQEWAKQVFPYAIAAIVPLAGLLLALAAFTERRTQHGLVLLGAAALGALIWTLALSL